ncbi:SDR family oxidoreductase [Natrialbaceae archaeon GCM10025810]|uniref:SDR family oxidoreductase n=1 Tax=Halovalidus salilacus TaxID=3075124 RepID=UPI0036100FC3
MAQTVLVAGAHGRVGSRLTELLAEGDRDVRGMVRDESQTDDIEDLGADPVVGDLTETVDHAVRGCDEIVFAAGSGGEDVYGVDRDGAITLIEAAEREGVDRFVTLSSMGAGNPDEGPDELRDYLIAKGAADDRLRESELTHTIARPGPLTDDPGTWEIRAAETLEEPGEISREDVARTLAASLDIEATRGKTFELLEGDEPIDSALRSVGP